MAIGVPLPSWLSHTHRVFGRHSLHEATLEYSDTNEDISSSLRCLDVQQGNVVIGVTGNADLLLLALRHNPAFIAGYDINPAQNALAELKRAAIERLSYSDYLALMGYRPSAQRGQLVSSVLEFVPEDVRTFWERREMAEAIDLDLWRHGSATRRDLDMWSSALRQLEARIGPHDLRVVLGIEGTREQRATLRARVARLDPKYAEPPIRNNNYFKFDAFRYPDGMVNQPAVARYAADFLPVDSIPPPLTEQDHEAIRGRLHRISFQTLSIGDALAGMPTDAFDRAYLSNITEYLTLEQERQLVNALLDKGKPASITVLLYVALSPAQHRDLLDHSTWSERGISRFLRASQWKHRLEPLPGLDEEGRGAPSDSTPATRIQTWTRSLGRAVDRFSRGGAPQAIARVRDRFRSLDPHEVQDEAVDGAKRAIQRVREFDYAQAGRRALSSTRSAWQEAHDRWAETRQLAEHDFVLIENEARTAALFSDVYANLRATYASKSFYGFDYAVLRKVLRQGATYEVPQQKDHD